MTEEEFRNGPARQRPLESFSDKPNQPTPSNPLGQSDREIEGARRLRVELDRALDERLATAGLLGDPGLGDDIARAIAAEVQSMRNALTTGRSPLDRNLEKEAMVHLRPLISRPIWRMTFSSTRRSARNEVRPLRKRYSHTRRLMA